MVLKRSNKPQYCNWNQSLWVWRQLPSAEG